MKQYTRNSGLDEDKVQYYYLGSGDKVITSGQFLPSGDSNFFDFYQDHSYHDGSGINHIFPEYNPHGTCLIKDYLVDGEKFPYESSGTLQTSYADDYSFHEVRESGIFHYQKESGEFSNAPHVWSRRKDEGAGKERHDWSISGQFYGPGVLENDDVGQFNPMIYYMPNENDYIDNRPRKSLKGIYINYLSDYGNQATNPVINTFGFNFIPQSPYHKKQ